MDGADTTLVRAWRLAFDPALSDEGWSVLEALLHELAAAGYVELGETAWNFTPEGIARINELVPDD